MLGVGADCRYPVSLISETINLCYNLYDNSSRGLILVLGGPDDEYRVLR